MGTIKRCVAPFALVAMYEDAQRLADALMPRQPRRLGASVT